MLIFYYFHTPLKFEVPKNVRIISTDDRESFLDELMNCNFIIYDISLDDSQVNEANIALEGK